LVALDLLIIRTPKGNLEKVTWSITAVDVKMSKLVATVHQCGLSRELDAYDENPFVSIMEGISKMHSAVIKVLFFA
jgi:hypothetical protein